MPARGTAHQNRQYGTKNKLFWEHGILPGPARASTGGERSHHDFAQDFMEAIQTRRSLTTLLDEQPLFTQQYAHNFIQSYNAIMSMQCKDRRSVMCIWLYGPTGSGKSKFAHDTFPDAYVKDPATIWWDGYLQERDVIVEDFEFQHPPITNLLSWFSRFKCRVQTKGGHTALSARRFIVTSNFSIDEIFAESLASVTRIYHVLALKRRFKECRIEDGL